MPDRLHHVAITFGDQGFRLYLDGLLSDVELEYTQGIATNPEPLALGANIWGRSPADPTYAREEFDGVIRDFTIYDHPLSRQEVERLAGIGPRISDVGRPISASERHEGVPPGGDKTLPVDQVFEAIGKLD